MVQTDKLFFDFNIVITDNRIYSSVCDILVHAVFGFSLVNFSWLRGDVRQLPSYDIYTSHLVRFSRCCTRVSNSIFEM